MQHTAEVALKQALHSDTLSTTIAPDWESGPCQQFGSGLDQPNPFCWLSATDALIVGTMLIAFSTVVIGVAIAFRRLTWDVPTSIVIAGCLALYTFPTLNQNPAARQLIAQAALGLALLIPTSLTIIAIQLELRAKFR